MYFHRKKLLALLLLLALGLSASFEVPWHRRKRLVYLRWKCGVFPPQKVTSFAFVACTGLIRVLKSALT